MLINRRPVICRIFPQRQQLRHGTTSSGWFEYAYNLNLTTCRFWGNYTNRGDVPIATAPAQSFGVSIVVMDESGNGYSFGIGSQNVPSAPQPGCTYSWDQTQKSAVIADNWASIAARNWANYGYHNQVILGDILNEIEQAIRDAISIINAAKPFITAIMAIV